MIHLRKKNVRRFKQNFCSVNFLKISDLKKKQSSKIGEGAQNNDKCK